MRIERAQVEHVARLARLGITEAEVEVYSRQISAILEAMEILNEIDTSGVEPTAQVTGLESVWRDDVVAPSLAAAEVLANAPRVDGDCFRVQAVFDELV